MTLDHGQPSSSLSPPISLIVPTHNRSSLLQDCLASLVAQEYDGESEIIVVDDGSTDDTPTVVLEYQLHRKRQEPRIVYILKDRNGANAARNTGVLSARGDIIFFLDDDEVIPAGHVQRTAEILSNRSEIEAIGGPYRSYSADEPRTCSHCSIVAKSPPRVRAGRTDTLLGGNMALRRSLIERTGLFDEQIKGRGEESELFARVPDATLAFDPELWVWHRKEHMTLRTLCKSGFHTGQAGPVYRHKVGASPLPRPVRLARSIGHAVRRGCAGGLLRAAIEVGGFVGYFKYLRRKRLFDHRPEVRPLP